MKNLSLTKKTLKQKKLFINILYGISINFIGLSVNLNIKIDKNIENKCNYSQSAFSVL